MLPRRSLALLPLLAALLAPVPASAAKKKKPPATREIVVVGNNWDGTASIVDVAKLKVVKKLNIIPDKTERERAIALDPVRLVYFNLIREQVGEGHNQYVDDAFSSKDGRRIFVSRPSYADVVAVDVKTGKQVWRFPVDGYRSDHMAISPDGRRLLVSASTANVVDVVDTKTGKKLGTFPSGDTPHENNFSKDGKRIYHASIGRVYTPTDDPSQDASKGKRIFEVVDAKTLKVTRTIDFGQELEKYGLGASAGVRPMAITPNERWLYVQLSFLSGFVEYDLKTGRATRIRLLPLLGKAIGEPRDQYPLDSAHHGLGMDPKGTKLCAAGTISDYAAIVRRASLTVQRIVKVGQKPYWSTGTLGGKYCFVSNSESDSVSVISWKTAKVRRTIKVGDHPQRMRGGRLRADVLR